MLIGKYYRLKYKLMELFFYWLYISFSDSIKILFWKIKDNKLIGRPNKLPWKNIEDRKFVVVVNDIVPRTDFSAGEKTLVNYINIYKKLGYNVK